MQRKFWTCVERCVNLGFVIFLSKIKSSKYVNKLEFVLRQLVSKVWLGFFLCVSLRAVKSFSFLYGRLFSNICTFYGKYDINLHILNVIAYKCVNEQ